MWGFARVVVAGLLLGSGCFIVPTTVHTPHLVDREQVNVVPPARAALGLEIASARGVLTFRAIAPRVCTREMWHHYDVRHDKRARLEASALDNDMSAVFAIVFAPLTLAVSGVITAIIVSSSDSTSTHERRKAGESHYECPVIGANVVVSLVLPSGATAEVATGVDGTASFAVPGGEPDSGAVEVRSSAFAPRQVTYCRACNGPAGAAPGR